MGTGEVTRYLGRYGCARVAKAAMFGVIPPFMLKTPDKPEGVGVKVFEDQKASMDDGGRGREIGTNPGRRSTPLNWYRPGDR